MNSTVLIGATFKKHEISHWENTLEKNEIFRIFPNSDGVPPDWTDPRYQYCQRVGAIPFISGKIDGNPRKLDALRDMLTTMKPWVKVLYLTDHHEPEGDRHLTPERFAANFNALMTMLDTELPVSVRSRIRCGPAMTKQWTENVNGGDYREWDPGTGDFFGVDAYLNSWAPGGGDTVFTRFPDAAAWLKKIKGYRYDSSDTRPRILPELGAIQPPWDIDGSARAAFLKDVHDELSSWNPATTGWQFQGWIWWNTEGTSGKSIAGIGTHRWFQLDRRHNSKPFDGDPIGGFEENAANKTLKMFNSLTRSEQLAITVEAPPAAAAAVPILQP
ncbi:hypothetical protein ACQP2E_13195 [Actinoplanes sp. CA-015351]|uniref:hypothetical protein n=1 Tax=Actinoplanes sp. CA-015351 TaxID=3239897 RepID=UPI003D987518